MAPTTGISFLVFGSTIAIRFLSGGHQSLARMTPVEENKERIISSMLKNKNGKLVIHTYGAHSFKLPFDYYNVLRLLALVLRRR